MFLQEEPLLSCRTSTMLLTYTTIEGDLSRAGTHPCAAAALHMTPRTSVNNSAHQISWLAVGQPHWIKRRSTARTPHPRLQPRAAAHIGAMSNLTST